MLKLKPLVSKKIWGYENWLVSTHEAGQSTVDERGGSTLKDAIGGNYPLIVKVIQADETLSVQVHPDDAYAARENSLGKCECWFVLDARQDAELVAGIKRGLTKSDVRAALEQDRLKAVLHKARVQRGNFLYIPAGLCHAIGGGMRLLEVQQSSDITYRFYDWGRGRELHVEKAFDVLETQEARIVEDFTGQHIFPHFSLERIEVPPPNAIAHNKTPLAERRITCESGTVLFVIEGSGVVAQLDSAAQKKHNANCSYEAATSVHIAEEDVLFFARDKIVTARGAMSIMKINPC